MKFKLRKADNANITVDGTYNVGDDAVLTVTPDEGNKVVYSPSGWYSVEEVETPERKEGGRQGTVS